MVIATMQVGLNAVFDPGLIFGCLRIGACQHLENLEKPQRLANGHKREKRYELCGTLRTLSFTPQENTAVGVLQCPAASPLGAKASSGSLY